MKISKKQAIMLVVMILSVGIVIGTVLTVDEQMNNLVATEQTIAEKVEKAIEKKFEEKQANIQLYVLSVDDVNAGERVHFYYRSDDNPFWRAHEIMEIEGFKYENLVIRESNLLEEEN